ncbi:MAG TPA: nucleotidyltransferase family protein [Rhodospirillaceae bacterium]|nr:nucleotidyltransferase family protein [Rhodospirillaceae bacterium]
MRPSEAIARHREELIEIAHRHGASNVRLFGSVIRGEDVEGSDVDLLIDANAGTGYFALARFQAEAEKLIGVPVDIHTPAGLKERVRQEVIAEARPL